ncbi:MAG TPA: hypothetical protein VLT89_16735 [Usitatibacter sp.]|nr:hypothetical protein [Usitatibacter sp.]
MNAPSPDVATFSGLERTLMRPGPQRAATVVLAPIGIASALAMALMAG